jgi:hypothetical protein
MPTFRKTIQGVFAKKIRAFWRRRFQKVLIGMKWPTVMAIWILSIILGYKGFYIFFEAEGLHLTSFDLLYRALQLVALEAGAVKGNVPWQLNVARFLMPALAAYAAIQALLSIFSKQWQIYLIRFYRNHVVICGLGERGLRLAKDFSSQGYRVVVIEGNRDNCLVEQCRKQGSVILFGNATSRSLLFKAGILKAKYLVAVCADDGTNAEIALKARGIVSTREGHDLTVFVHMVDLELCNLLRGWEMAAEARSFRLEFFNVHERGARLMLATYESIDKKPLNGQPRILLVGLGKLGRSLLLQAARDLYLKKLPENNRMLITVIDKSAESKISLLRMQYPQLDKVCEIETWQIDENAPEFEKAAFLFDDKGNLKIDVIFICFDDDIHALVNAFTLYRKTRELKVPIIARMGQESGLAAMIRDERYSLGFEHIHTFGLLDKTCNLKSLLGGTHEVIARAIHDDYINCQKQAGESSSTNPSMVDWNSLPETIKESNRHQAAHIEVKIKAIGCGIQPLNDWEAASFSFEPEEIEQLAVLEHKRWVEERRQNGWLFKPGTKNIAKKTSPHMVPYEELSWEIKESDRNMIRNLPSFLAKAGFQIYRRNENDKKNEPERSGVDTPSD